MDLFSSQSLLYYKHKEREGWEGGDRWTENKQTQRDGRREGGWQASRGRDRGRRERERQSHRDRAGGAKRETETDRQTEEREREKERERC